MTAVTLRNYQPADKPMAGARCANPRYRTCPTLPDPSSDEISAAPRRALPPRHQTGQSEASFGRTRGRRGADANRETRTTRSVSRQVSEGGTAGIESRVWHRPRLPPVDPVDDLAPTHANRNRSARYARQAELPAVPSRHRPRPVVSAPHRRPARRRRRQPHLRGPAMGHLARLEAGPASRRPSARCRRGGPTSTEGRDKNRLSG